MAINKDEIFLNRSEIKKEAARLHEMGYNCAQSVVCAMDPPSTSMQTAPLYWRRALAPAWAA